MATRPDDIERPVLQIETADGDRDDGSDSINEFESEESQRPARALSNDSQNTPRADTEIHEELSAALEQLALSYEEILEINGDNREVLVSFIEVVV